MEKQLRNLSKESNNPKLHGVTLSTLLGCKTTQKVGYPRTPEV